MGGIPPFTWSLAPGSAALPAGLNLSSTGVISGTPLAAGTTTNLIAQVTDSSNPQLTATKNLSLVIVAPPTLATLTPSSTLAGGTSFPLTADGTDFLPGAELLWNGSPRVSTTVPSATQVMATIPSADIATAGSAMVQVRNPGGGISNSLLFTITNPIGGPSISSISPASGLVGVAVALTVLGTNFPVNSQIFWNGVAQTTTRVSSSQLTATIAAGDVASAGPIPVHVFAGGPAGGTSNTQNFTANNPLPTLATATPPRAVAGRPGFTLTLDGSGFVAGSPLLWNGSPRVTTIVSPTQITADVLDADVIVAGGAQLQMFNSAPGGGASNVLTYDINNPLPQITSISPDTVPFGSPAFTITVTGTDFVDSNPLASPSTASVVRWNLTTPLVTTFVNGTTLTALVPAALLATPGSALVDVFNPLPGGGAAGGMTFTIDPIAPSSSGAFGIVSAAPTGAPGAGTSSHPRVSRDGQFVAFTSAAMLSVPPSPLGGIFLRDTSNGTTALASASSPGNPSIGAGELGVDVTPDGRFVIFWSFADDLVAGDVPGTADVFVRDTCAGTIAGCLPSTLRVSVDNSGAPLALIQVGGVSISSDGRHVAFGGGSPRRIFVRDRDNANTIEVSVDDTGAPLGFTATSPSLSADGRYVVFSADTATGREIYVHDRDADVNGIFDEQAVAGAIKTTLVSVASDGTPANGASCCASISKDGRVVAFLSNADNLDIPTSASVSHVYAHDRDADGDRIFDEAGASERRTRLASIGLAGVEGNAGDTVNPLGGYLSADGRFVTFSSFASNLVAAADLNSNEDIFVRDACLGADAPAGCIPRTLRLSQRLDGTQGDGNERVPAISGDGRRVAFSSSSTNLVDVNGDGMFNDTGPPFFQVLLAATGMIPAPSPAPTLSGVTPASVIAGRPEFILTVTGTGFTPESVVHWSSFAQPTFYAGPTKLLARIPALRVALPGVETVTVVNPAPGGTSAAIPFTVTP